MTTSRTEDARVALTARPNATHHWLMPGSMTCRSETSHAASPAGTIRTGPADESTRSLALQAVQQLVVNAVEAAVRHHHDQISVAGFLRHRLDDVVRGGNVARVDPLLLEVADDLLCRQTLLVRQRRAKDRGEDHAVRAGECTRE